MRQVLGHENHYPLCRVTSAKQRTSIQIFGVIQTAGTWRKHSGRGRIKKRMVSQGERNPRQFIAAKDKISEHYSIERLSRSPAFLKSSIGGKMILLSSLPD
jgi:hypothetical protein